MRYGIVARPRACACVLALAGASLLALAGGAIAETYKVSNTQQFVEAVGKANANPGANTIVLASGAYLPSATQTFTNTTGVQTVEGPTSFPPAKLEGGAVEPTFAELVVIKPSVSVTFKNIEVSTGGGSGNPAIDDFGTLDIENSTIAGNNGAGVHVESGGTGIVRNSTLSDGLDFGLIDNGTTSFFNSTVAFNKNGGIENKNTVNLTNTIVAKNTGAGDCVGAATTGDQSLDSDGTCGVALSKKDPLLGKLVNNGGPTPTHALEKGSPAIDAADKAMCTTVDQRGAVRPDVAGTACDVGAYEFYEPSHWYKNGVIIEQPAPDIAWGTLTLSNGSIGALKCQTFAGGRIENPVGGGAGRGRFDAFFAYNCTAPACESVGGTPELIPEKLGWPSVLSIEEPSVNRDKIEAIGLRVLCAASGTNVEFNGSLTPKALNGTSIGAAPSKLEFNAAAGRLQSVVGTGELAGKMKLMGYEGQDLLQLKSP